MHTQRALGSSGVVHVRIAFFFAVTGRMDNGIGQVLIEPRQYRVVRRASRKVAYSSIFGLLPK
jgi:hypothetical protein